MKSFFSGTTILAIIACMLWATAFVGIKIGLQYTTPLQFAGIRFFFSGVMILPLIKGLTSKILNLKYYWKSIVWIGFLQTFLLYALFYTGISMVPGSLGAMIIGSGPLFAALVAHFLMKDDKMNFRKLSCILLGMTGVGIISFGRKDLTMEGGMILIGILILLLNNIAAGFGNVMVAKDRNQIPPLVMSSFSMIVGGGALFLFSIPIEGYQWKTYPVEYYVALGWLSFLSAAAISIWYTLLTRPGVKVSDLNMWKFIIPVLGAILSWTILPGEYPDAISLIGMLVIAISLLALNFFNRKAALKKEALRQRL
ncbi:DMT family transporter [Puteibacter caeruleilacunae]|nr:DMT family transporter [Puteibacter caeruleilacunae]